MITLITFQELKLIKNLLQMKLLVNNIYYLKKKKIKIKIKIKLKIKN